MKQTITLTISAIFFVVISANAQINKGSVMLGGTISAYTGNLKDSDSSVAKLNSVSVAPALGFAVNTNTILGFSLSYSSANNKYYGTVNEQKYHSYGAGVFLRKYKPLAKGFYMFGDGNLMYTYSSYNYSAHNSTGIAYDSKAHSVSLNVTPGIAYNLTRSIQLESGLQNLLYVSYGSSNEKSKDPANGTSFKENSFSIGTALNPISFNGIFVGFRFLFNK